MSNLSGKDSGCSSKSNHRVRRVVFVIRPLAHTLGSSNLSRKSHVVVSVKQRCWGSKFPEASEPEKVSMSRSLGQVTDKVLIYGSYMHPGCSSKSLK